MSRHNFEHFVYFAVLVICILQAQAAPEGPPRALFRPRSPVHFKGLSDQGALRKKIDDRLSSTNRFSSSPTSLPPIKDVTPSEDGNSKSSVRIFSAGTTSSVTAGTTPPTISFSILQRSTSPKSLLDDTEPLGSYDDHVSPTNPSVQDDPEGTEGDLEESNEVDSVTEREKSKELEGQETIYGGVFGVATPTVYTRPLFSGRLRPNSYSATLGSATPSSGSGATVMVPVATRPPLPPPTVPTATQVPILGVGPSPPITSVQMPAPPTRSLFSSGRASVLGRNRPLTARDSVFKSSSYSPIGGNIRTSADDQSNIITDFMFSDIKCYRTKQKEYFGAKIHLKSGFHVPYIRARPNDPLTSSECQLEPTRDSNTFHMKMNDLRACGVEQCGESMCITMVFPRMPTLALADDEVTTIKCLPQKSSMAEMKTISFVGDAVENRRSGSTVEGGGQDFAAEVGVFRQNTGASNGLFVKRINSGGVVQLGEPLQLRSVVRGGDGWTFSKLTEVKVWRMRDSYGPLVAAGRTLNPADASEAITLVDDRGCRNEEFRVIADSDPLRDPRNDLVHHFTFKAFLFRGQRSNEPLIVTAKVQACQERDDCDFIDCSATQSSDDGRYKRSLENSDKNSNFTSMNYSSQLALRVIGLDEQDDFSDSSITEPEVQYNSQFACSNKIVVSVAFATFLTTVLWILSFALFLYCRSGENLKTNHENPLMYRKKPLQRHVSANGSTTGDFIRYSNEAQNHPKNLHSSAPRSLSNQHHSVAKLLQELADERSSEYLPATNSDQNDDDGVYVVYYKRSRSSSAPGSLREKPTSKRCAMTDLEDSDDDGDWSKNLGRSRQTVRSVKKRSQRRQRRTRKEIPDIYRQPRKNRGSTVSTTNTPENFGSRTSIRIGPDSNESETNQSTTALAQFASSEVNTTNCTTHFVTRNQNSTQIVIIPETNV